MWNGVVNVEKIERIELRDLGHARRQGQIVGRMLEERVVRDGDLVKMDIGLAARESERLRVSDEVDVVAARGEFNAEFGSDDSAAAVGGITGDADLHRSLSWPWASWLICP